MINDQEDRLVYRMVSILFITLVVAIIFFDVGGKYFKNDMAIFSITSPLIFPFLVLVVLLVCIIFEWGIVIKKVRQAINLRRRKESHQQAKNLYFRKEIIDMVVFIILSLIYIFLLPKLHFIYATSIFMFSLMVAINDQDKFIIKTLKALLATGITIPVIYYIFYGIFGVILP